MEFKTIDEIHFSIHSVLVTLELRHKFYEWVQGDSYVYVIDWLSSPISKTEFPEDISWKDVIDYSEGHPFTNRSLSDTESDMLRLLRMETAERLFDKFLHEGLDKSTVFPAASTAKSLPFMSSRKKESPSSAQKETVF